MKASILAKLDHLSERYEEVGALLSDGDIISDQNRFRSLSKEYAELEPVVKSYQEYQSVLENIEEAKLLLKDSDEDMREMGQEELRSGEVRREALELELQKLLLPKDPNDAKNVFLEIRAGTGGDEAAIFSGDLFRMYSRYAETQRWKVEVISESQGEHGGYKEIIARIVGQGVFPNLNLNLVPTGYSEYRKQSPRAEFTPLPAPWQLWPRQMSRMPLRSIRRICGSTHSVPPALVVSTLTKPTRQSVSHTCLQVW